MRTFLMIIQFLVSIADRVVVLQESKGEGWAHSVEEVLCSSTAARGVKSS